MKETEQGEGHGTKQEMSWGDERVCVCGLKRERETREGGGEERETEAPVDRPECLTFKNDRFWIPGTTHVLYKVHSLSKQSWNQCPSSQSKLYT